MKASLVLVALLFTTVSTFANPYYDETKVPREGFRDLSSFNKYFTSLANSLGKAHGQIQPGTEVLKVRVDFDEKNERYTLGAIRKETSGTPGLVARSPHEDKMGSYKAILIDRETQKAIYYAAVGTGKEYRR